MNSVPQYPSFQLNNEEKESCEAETYEKTILLKKEVRLPEEINDIYDERKQFEEIEISFISKISEQSFHSKNYEFLPSSKLNKSCVSNKQSSLLSGKCQKEQFKNYSAYSGIYNSVLNHAFVEDNIQPDPQQSNFEIQSFVLDEELEQNNQKQISFENEQALSQIEKINYSGKKNSKKSGLKRPRCYKNIGEIFENEEQSKFFKMRVQQNQQVKMSHNQRALSSDKNRLQNIEQSIMFNSQSDNSQGTMQIEILNNIISKLGSSFKEQNHIYEQQ